MIGALAYASGPTLGTGTDTFQHASAVNHNGLDIDIAVIQLLALVRILGFPVGDGAAEKFLETD